MKAKTITWIILLLVAVFILLQNMEDVDIELLLWDIEIPKLILMMSTLLLGWIAGWIMHMIHLKNKQVKAQRKETPVEPETEDNVEN